MIATDLTMITDRDPVNHARDNRHLLREQGVWNMDAPYEPEVMRYNPLRSLWQDPVSSIALFNTIH